MRDGQAIVYVHGTRRADGKVVDQFTHSGTLLSSGGPLSRDQLDEAARALGLS